MTRDTSGNKKHTLAMRWQPTRRGLLRTCGWAIVLATYVTSSFEVVPKLYGQEQVDSAASSQESDDATFISFPRFRIPFNIEGRSAELQKIQLWVSTDEGTSWQLHGAASPDESGFEFRAAAEGLYFFSVRTVDPHGDTRPGAAAPLKVIVDTTEPEAAVRADTNSIGQLVIDVRVHDEHFDASSADLRMRTNRDEHWSQLQITDWTLVDSIHRAQLTIDLPDCREVGIAFTAADLAANRTEAATTYSVPRTASAEKEMTLASTGAGGQQSGGRIPPIPGAVDWRPAAPRARSMSQPPAKQRTSRTGMPQGPGRLTNAPSELELESSFPGAAPSRPAMSQHSPALPNPQLPSSSIEELPAPSPGLENDALSQAVPAVSDAFPPGGLPVSQESGRRGNDQQDMLELGQAQVPTPNQVVPNTDGISDDHALLDDALVNAYQCKAQAFSLDYSVEALGGSKLSSVELWGTEDGGRTWEKWGADPDRVSPFDVRVGNDGLFGFRMVVVGSNGIVGNRPKNGDSADVWINIDSQPPEVRITRAVYGEGQEDGMLVIDYECSDGNLVSRPVNLAFSERQDGPWTTIATGEENKGIYLWKADPRLPERIYLRIEAVDKAGNVGSQRMDLPINTQGLAPRGRIQGFRPILNPQ